MANCIECAESACKDHLCKIGIERASLFSIKCADWKPAQWYLAEQKRKEERRVRGLLV